MALATVFIIKVYKNVKSKLWEYFFNMNSNDRVKKIMIGLVFVLTSQ
jgi:hypothetical protein